MNLGQVYTKMGVKGDLDKEKGFAANLHRDHFESRDKKTGRAGYRMSQEEKSLTCVRCGYCHMYKTVMYKEMSKLIILPEHELAARLAKLGDESKIPKYKEKRS